MAEETVVQDQAVSPVQESVVEAEPTSTPEEVTAPPETPVEPTPTPEDLQARKHASAQKRINQVIREKSDLARERDYWKQQAEARAQAAAPVAPADQKPTPDQFQTTEDYVEAVAGWKATQIVKSIQTETVQQAAERAAQEEVRATVARFEPLVEAARAKYEDFDEVTSAPVYSPQTQQLIYASPQGAEIAYHLALNPQEADRINRLGVVAASREIVKLEAQFAPPVPKTISKAPTPIRPVSGAVPVEADPNKMSVEDWMANRRQQLTRKG